MRRLAACAALVLLASCGDPVHDDQVDALGGEAPGVPQGEFHRAGQPCAVCHGGQGPASSTFTLAGTVFSDPTGTTGVNAATVYFVDDNKAHYSVPTNCVGNFFVTPGDWSPAFPLEVAIVKGSAGAQMIGHISREASCAFCHKDPPGTDSPGHVFMLTPNPQDNQTCPVNPVAGGGG